MEKLKREISKYRLDEFLLRSGEILRSMIDDKPYKEISVSLPNIGNFHHTGRLMLSAWGLSDMVYIAINSTTDHREEIPTNNDIYRLYNQYLIAKENVGKKLSENIPQEQRLERIFLQTAQNQFWYQKLCFRKFTFYSYIRNQILLHEIPNIFNYHPSPDEDLLKITGFNVIDFSTLLFFVWGHSYRISSEMTTIRIADDLRIRNPILSEENLRKCINFFAEEYSFYRDSAFSIHGYNPLLLKPIVKTKTGRFIVPDAFILARKFYEGVYWLLRDYYKNEDQFFTVNFGKYYEKYVEKILTYYLKPEQFKRVEGKGEKADWLVISSKYILVVEQKSSLMPISLKGEYLEFEDLDKYLQKFVKAFSQIAKTVENLRQTNKQIVKLVLHFESLYFGEAIIKERVKRLCEDTIKDISNYFLIETDEFERLIQLLSDDDIRFNILIEEKINEESKKLGPEGKEFWHFFKKHGVSGEIRFLESHSNLFDGLVDVPQPT